MVGRTPRPRHPSKSLQTLTVSLPLAPLMKGWECRLYRHPPLGLTESKLSEVFPLLVHA